MGRYRTAWAAWWKNTRVSEPHTARRAGRSQSTRSHGVEALEHVQLIHGLVVRSRKRLPDAPMPRAKIRMGHRTGRAAPSEDSVFGTPEM